MSSILIHLPAALSERSGGASTVMVDAGSVSDALLALAARHPDLDRLLFQRPGILRPYVNVFVDDRRVVNAAEEPPLSDGDEIRIVPSIAGG